MFWHHNRVITPQALDWKPYSPLGATRNKRERRRTEDRGETSTLGYRVTMASHKAISCYLHSHNTSGYGFEIEHPHKQEQSTKKHIMEYSYV